MMQIDIKVDKVAKSNMKPWSIEHHFYLKIAW
jgi:hypothetical protein